MSLKGPIDKHPCLLADLGIGLMMVKALEENGAKVYIIGRRMEALDKVAKEEAVGLVLMQPNFSIIGAVTAAKC